ncbi:MAG: hypothetical protein HYY24_17570 [Verrucomicrobia bacterium]|nr:hypothetical protein [Verrucomicrobiota bacterium]
MSTLTLKSILVAALLTTSLAATFAQAPTPLLTQPADKLIAVLQSSADQKEKGDACRELSVLGTQAAVPALVALLADEKLNHMARYALETIPDPGVDKALRDQLGKLTGRPLVGVIGSLGVRRDVYAVKPLTGLLQNADADVAQAAARALGKIGTPAPAKAIQAALDTVPAANQVAFCEGLFRCAETLAAKGQRTEALAIYEKLRGLQPAPHQVRAGALRGAILANPKTAPALIREALRSEDFVLVAAAARAALETPGPAVTKAMTDDLKQLSADKQILVIQTLGKRGDVAALPFLSMLAKTGAAPVRLAAVRAVPELSRPSTAAASLLAELLADADREIAQAAQQGLAALPGAAADATVMKLLASTDTNQQVAGIEMAARRRMTVAVPALRKAAGSGDAQVRRAALVRLGDLADAGELPALLDLLLRAKGSEDLDAAEQALSAVCAKDKNPESCSDKVAGLLPSAPAAQQGVLLRVLARIGGASALKTVRAAVGSSDTAVHAVAIRALGDWRSFEAASDLLDLARSSPEVADKALCLRGVLRLAADADAPADQRLSLCRQAAALAQQTDEKKLLLGALGGLKNTESLALIVPYLDDAGAKAEASAATVAVAEELLKAGNAAAVAPKLIEPLQKAVQAAASENLVRRAKAQLQKAQDKAGGR